MPDKKNPFRGTTVQLRSEVRKMSRPLEGVPTNQIKERQNLRGESSDDFVSLYKGVEGIHIRWKGHGGPRWVPLYLLESAQLFAK